MVTTYVISLVVEGKDKGASSMLKNVSGALGGVGTVAGGILSAQFLTRIAQGIGDLFTKAWDAVGSMQQLQMGLESLAAVELVNTGVASDFNDALAQAGPMAKEAYDWVRKLSTTSPYEFETVNSAFQMNIAFGQSFELAKKTTGALLNYSSATGMSQAQMQGLAYALAQVSSAQRITGVDIRQFANNRFGLESLNRVFAVMSERTGTVIKNYEDFNAAVDAGKVTTEDFFTAFSEFVEKGYGNSAERMTRTLPGIMSNIKDVMFFSFADLFGDSGQVLADFLLPYLDKTIDFLQSGGFKQVGEKLGKDFKTILDNVGGFIDRITGFFRAIKQVGSSGMGGFFASFFNLPPEVGVFIQHLIDDFKNLKGAGSEFLPTLKEIAGLLLDGLLKGLQFVNEHWEEFKAGLLGVGAVLVGAGLFSAITAIGAAIAALNFPLILIAGVVALLAAAWAGNWFDIQGKTAAGVAWIKGAIQSVVDFVTPLWNFFLLKWSEVTGIFHLAQQGKWFEFGAALRGLVDNFMESIMTSIGAGIGRIVDKFGELIQKSKDKFMKTNWSEIGKNIITGIVQGLIQNVGALIEQMIAIAQAAYEAAMGFLLAESPSRLFMQVGKYIMQGWAMGISDSMGLPLNSLNNALLGMFRGPLAPAYANATGPSYTNYDQSAKYYAPVTQVVQSTEESVTDTLNVRL